MSQIPYHLPQRPPLKISPDRDILREYEPSELILKENPGRWVLLPVEFPTMFAFYKKIESNFWTPDEFSWNDEAERLRVGGRLGALSAQTLARIFAHVTISSGIPADANSIQHRDSCVVDPILYHDVLDFTCELTEHIQSPEARAFLGFQNMFENIQRESASLIVKATAGKPLGAEDYRRESELPELLAKHIWVHSHAEGFIDEVKIKKLAGDPDAYRTFEGKHCLNPAPLYEVICAFGVFKGILSSAAIQILTYCLKDEETSAIATACKRLGRDLALQADFLFHLYSSFEHKLDYESFNVMMTTGLELEYNYLMTVFEEIRDGDFAVHVGAFLRAMGTRFTRLAYPDIHDVQFDSQLPGADSRVLIDLPEMMEIDMSKGFYTPEDVSCHNVGGELTSAGPSEPVAYRFVQDDDF